MIITSATTRVTTKGTLHEIARGKEVRGKCNGGRRRAGTVGLDRHTEAAARVWLGLHTARLKSATIERGERVLIIREGEAPVLYECREGN